MREEAVLGLFSRRTGREASVVQQRGCVGMPVHFSIIDVETTGLDSSRDRIIEIAVVIMDSTGNFLHEWTTLVNPGDGRSGPEHIHGIKGDWLAAAPAFSDIIGDLRNVIEGRVLTAHNTTFDIGFVVAELQRAGVTPNGLVPTFDTMETAESAGLPRSLRGACSYFGIDYRPHDALEDARAAGLLLARLLPYMPPSTFPVTALVPAGWIPSAVAATGRVCRRGEAEHATKPSDFLASAVTLLPPFDPSASRDGQGGRAYRDLVASAIADGYVSTEESSTLIDAASSLGLSVAEARDVHHELFLSLLDAALIDRKLSKDEKADLERAAGWLGIDISDWDSLVKAARTRVKNAQSEFRSEMSGKAVAFTGRGVHPNNVREGLCAKLGVQFKTTVSKETSMLVVGSLDTENANVGKAHELGIPIMLESTFWQRLGEM